MLKSTLLCFGIITTINGSPSVNTCIPLIKPQYTTPSSKEATKGLKTLQQTFFKKPKMVQIDSIVEDKPTKPILIIEAQQNK